MSCLEIMNWAVRPSHSNIQQNTAIHIRCKKGKHENRTTWFVVEKKSFVEFGITLSLQHTPTRCSVHGSCPTYECSACQWVMPFVCRSNVPHLNGSVWYFSAFIVRTHTHTQTHIHVCACMWSCLKFEWVMSQIWMNRVSHIRIWMSDWGTFFNLLWFLFKESRVLMKTNRVYFSTFFFHMPQRKARCLSFLPFSLSPSPSISLWLLPLPSFATNLSLCLLLSLSLSVSLCLSRLSRWRSRCD